MPTESTRLNYTSIQPNKCTKNLLYKNQLYDYYGEKQEGNEETNDVIRHSEPMNSPECSSVPMKSYKNTVENEYLIINNDSVEFDSSYVSRSTRLKAVSPKIFNPKDGISNNGKQYVSSDKTKSKDTLKYIAMYRQAIRNSNGHNRSQTEINLENVDENYELKVHEIGKRNRHSLDKCGETLTIKYQPIDDR